MEETWSERQQNGLPLKGVLISKSVDRGYSRLQSILQSSLQSTLGVQSMKRSKSSPLHLIGDNICIGYLEGFRRIGVLGNDVARENDTVHTLQRP